MKTSSYRIPISVNTLDHRERHGSLAVTSLCDGVEHLQRFGGVDCPGIDEALFAVQTVARFVDTCRDDDRSAV